MTDHGIKKLGPYHIEGVLGRGGMGSVFAATHEETGENAAIKVLAPALAADETFRDRFAAEIDSLRTLHHPHIVTLHGYGESEGHLYYAMELVDGTNLEQELQRGRHFSWREVTQIGIDIARALKHAHDHGVIHRDLKPANLLLDRNDNVKLTDFGIAKLFGATNQTFGDSVLGTAEYMAPEQAAGEATTPRCDLYSLGCVMYAMLAGTPPFRGKSIAELVHKVRYEQHMPLTKYVTDVPHDLRVIIDELLQKDPEARIRTALSLTHRLRSIQQALSISTTAEDEFSSDVPTTNAYVPENRIVNPPPDIAERPTVHLQGFQNTPTEKSKPALAASEPTSKKLDHFTRFELQHVKTESNRGNEFTSAVPLLLLLLTVLSGLIGGIWYSMLPPSAVDLHARIMRVSNDANRIMSAERDVDLFISKYPDDPRYDRVLAVREQIAVRRLQQDLESRARRREETGVLSPIEVHCYEAFRLYREGNLELAIQKLQGVELMFGDENRKSDINVQRTLVVVDQLLGDWGEELKSQTEDLLTNLKVYAELARELSDEEPGRAQRIWQGIVDLYRDKPWAEEFTTEAQEALQELAATTSDADSS